MPSRRAALSLITLALCTLAGCQAAPHSQSQPDITFAIAPGDYDTAFNATRDVLRDYRFTLDRVDAQAGVITTTLQPAAGLIAPWERAQSTAGDEFEDLLNQQSRRVRIDFIESNTKGVVTVAVERTHTAHLRPAQIVGLTTQAYDPQAEAKGQPAVYNVVIRRDDDLARRLASEITRATARVQPSDNK
ncbi:MAG TPA: hypothetical protein VK157_05895 [Phycisphaerales bacterium]|nr:hypothetical protein [Phycisphaerales bacterium]